MFFFLVLILLLILFMILFRFKSRNTFPTALFFSYFAAILSMVFYISKDSYYYNLIRNYFYLPPALWRWLFFIDISKSNIIRIMTLSSLSILIISVYFSLRFYHPKHEKTKKIILSIVWSYCLLQLIIYDPAVDLKVYYALYPDFLSVEQYLAAEQHIFAFTRAANNLLILASLSFIIMAYFKAPKLKIFRLHYLFLAVSYSILTFVYIYFISSVPAFYLKISKISGTLSYRSIPLRSDALIYNILPYFLIAAAIIIAFCVYRLVKYTNETSLNEFRLSKEISSSETTSKIFCHYIKNEILAISSELEMLTGQKEDTTLIEDLKKRCGILYSRIDEIHRSTKTSELSLKTCSLQKLLSETLDEFSLKPDTITVVTEYPKNEAYALIDPVYMGQALHNIIRNSLDAMLELPAEKRKLTIKLKTIPPWIQLEITDTGKGISEENLEHIFLPFYSSHTYSTHWGVGLTLTYKIITAHEGKIAAESVAGAGTTMRILLPRLQIVSGGK